MADIKKGKTKIQKFEYLENERGFSDEIKSIFHNYLRGKNDLVKKMKNSGHKL